MRENFRHLFFVIGTICIISFALHPLTHIDDEFSLTQNHAEEEFHSSEDHERECELCSINEESADLDLDTELHFSWVASENQGSSQPTFYSISTRFKARAPPL